MLTAEWIEKAEEDFGMMQRERRTRKKLRNYGTIIGDGEALENHFDNGLLL